MLDSVPSFRRLVDELSKLPGVGRKTAARLAFHLLQQNESQVRALAEAMLDVKKKTFFCSRCFHLTETDPCNLCTDPARDDRQLCVVEDSRGLISILRSRSFRGRFHVLQGALSPLDGVGPDELRIAELLRRLEGGAVEEVLIATNFTVEGDATALYLEGLIKPLGIRVTRLAFGIPLGSDLEYVDDATINRAIEGRREL